MRNTNLRKKLLEITDGIFATLIDFILAEIFFMITLGGSFAVSSRGIWQATREADELLAEINYESIKQAIVSLKRKKLLNKNLMLSKAGKEKINKIFNFKKVRNKNKKWLMVIFDIPEKMRFRRNIFRSFLKRLKFGRLQASVWISPRDYRKEINDFLSFYGLSSFVITIFLDKESLFGGLDESDIQRLINRLWAIKKLDKEYKDLINNYKKKNFSFIQLGLKYLNIVNKDPQLPQEFLPKDWKGDFVRQLFTINKDG